ncbi:hypothetical protein E2C01_061061 [Portunus trituberculatus]|uniref:Uncharacterized protein n=1 Tax=Portunus trituberculatus TaxID=210409 RepID=A0A5B7HAD0_PORTR|nr:hypothetical protein [Portunus trituberculatus]
MQQCTCSPFPFRRAHEAFTASLTAARKSEPRVTVALDERKKEKVVDVVVVALAVVVAVVVVLLLVVTIEENFYL